MGKDEQKCNGQKVYTEGGEKGAGPGGRTLVGAR